MHPILQGILNKAPELIAIARQLAETVKTGKKSAEVAERVATLERNEAQQAELVKQMTRQLDDMTRLMKVLSVRIAVCLACSIGALVLAVVALLYASAK